MAAGCRGRGTDPQLLLLPPQGLVLDGGEVQLAEGGQRVLEPGAQLLVGLPELAGQGLGALQLQTALRVQLADRRVPLHQRLTLSLRGRRRALDSVAEIITFTLLMVLIYCC